MLGLSSTTRGFIIIQKGLFPPWDWGTCTTLDITVDMSHDHIGDFPCHKFCEWSFLQGIFLLAF